MQLYFTRHGRTEWNLEGRFQGREGDSPLLPESYVEIQKLGEYLKDVPFAAIYASSAPRALTTAKEIAKHLKTNVPIIETDDLREMGFGRLEGRLFTEVNQEYPEASQMRKRLDKYDPTPFNGEPIGHLLRRIENVVTTAAKAHLDEGPVLFVGHGASFAASIPWLIGKPLSELRELGSLKNSSLTILETQTGDLPYQLKVWNETNFLAEK
ncbi:histidine phosphatase family protein [Enterococcus cecorum]|uniref:histidine phosphatase family protein n=1 Tax=Enterococcus cecorum TaxID=44008 RepID=UPI001FAC7EF9|nr:histidine phosphatase family protein [Enterococcus cecorum]MCJ0605044.1 histidine phosphatase family protein [Enterococcus cecorum]